MIDFATFPCTRASPPPQMTPSLYFRDSPKCHSGRRVFDPCDFFPRAFRGPFLLVTQRNPNLCWHPPGQGVIMGRSHIFRGGDSPSRNGPWPAEPTNFYFINLFRHYFYFLCVGTLEMSLFQMTPRRVWDDDFIPCNVEIFLLCSIRLLHIPSILVKRKCRMKMIFWRTWIAW